MLLLSALLLALTILFSLWYLDTARRRCRDLPEERRHDHTFMVLSGFPILVSFGIATNGIAAFAMMAQARMRSLGRPSLSGTILEEQLFAFGAMVGIMFLMRQAMRSVELEPDDPPGIASLRVQAEYCSRVVRRHWLLVLALAGASGSVVRYEITLPLAGIFTLLWIVSRLIVLRHDLLLTGAGIEEMALETDDGSLGLAGPGLTSDRQARPE